jgi:putative ABC transport system substrate-binding protein
MGFIKSLSHPGGTVTGLSSNADEIAAKRLALFKEAVPTIKRLAVFTQAGDSGSNVQIKQIEKSSGLLGIQVKVFPITAAPEDIERAVNSVVAWNADSVFRTLGRGLGAASNKFLAESLLKHKLPAMLLNQADVQNGGLMSYVLDLDEAWRIIAQYVDRILRGTTPADLPVATPIHFKLSLNLKTARILGVTIPSSIVVFADQVIE